MVRGKSPVAGYGKPVILTNVPCVLKPKPYPPRIKESTIMKNSGDSFCQLTVDFEASVHVPYRPDSTMTTMDENDYLEKMNYVYEYQLYIREHGTTHPYRLVGVSTKQPDKRQMKAIRDFQANLRRTTVIPA